MVNTKIIFQNGQDGFGHQLHGLHSLLALHGIDGYTFDSLRYINKDFEFDHFDYTSFPNLVDFLKSGVNKYFENNHIQYEADYVIHPHEMIHEKDYMSDYVYSYDNGFPLIDKYLNDKRVLNNIEKLKKSFNSYKNQKDMICVHLRLGDALLTKARIKKLLLYTIKALLLVNKINKKNNYDVIIHTDGDNKILNIILKLFRIYNYHLYDKNTDILSVLDDMMNSKIFVSSVSSLSTVATSLGSQEVVYVPSYFKYYKNENKLYYHY